jgi:large subunit ribosomal protein L29
MKIQEIRELSLSELSARRGHLSEEIFHLRVKQKTGQLEKPSELKALRREAARVETVLTQKRVSEPKKA